MTDYTDLHLKVFLALWLFGPLFFLLLAFIDKKNNEVNFYSTFFLIIILVIGYVIWVSRPQPPSKEQNMKSNIHAFRITLERYFQDTGSYPDNIDDLISEKYMISFPLNPYKRRHEPMIEVEIGAEDFEGNFTYIPVFSDDIISNYFLIGYGDDEYPGLDVDFDGVTDHAVKVASDDEEYDAYEEYKAYATGVLEQTDSEDF